jgi:hypothetical protein
LGAGASPADPCINAGGAPAVHDLLSGSKFGYDGPIPSIRLNTMRRGLQDLSFFEFSKPAERKRAGN